MVFNKSQIGMVNETGEILILASFFLAIMAISFAFDRWIKYLKIKKSGKENVIVSKLKWDFFYALFIEGLVDILVSIAQAILVIIGLEIGSQ